jgi:hypothetical protein
MILGDKPLISEVVLSQKETQRKAGNGYVVDCEAPSTFYWSEDGGETVLWRRNGRWRVEFFNASVSGRREEGAMPISEVERSTLGGSWFPCRGATGECSGAAASGGQQLELGSVWIDPRWKTTSQANLDIKQAIEMEWAGKERFLGRKKRLWRRIWMGTV